MSPKVIAGGLVALALIAIGIAALTGGGDDGGGDTLALGATGVVEYAPLDESGTPGTPTTLAVTVTDVREGSQDDLTEAGFEADDPNSTPHYVNTRFENQGEAPVKRNLSVTLEGEDEQSLPSTVVFDFGGKGFEPCQEVTEGTLEPGESYESCTIVLVPEGEEAETVLFVSQTADDIVFTRWDASAP